MTNLSAPKIRLALGTLVFVIISTACTTFPAQDFKGIKAWINSEPLTLEDLRGKVVLIDFWTYTCVSCLRTVPYLQQWNTKYANDGLVIVGVHSRHLNSKRIIQTYSKRHRKMASTGQWHRITISRPGTNGVISSGRRNT